MNRVQILFRGPKLAMILMVILFGHSTTAFAKQKGCWAEFYEYAQMIGDHFRIDGPTALKNLKKVNGENWESRIDSIVVGPNAKVTVFENIDFKLTLTEMAQYPVLMRSLGITEEDIKQDSELIFNAKEMVHHLGQYNFHKKTKSLKVDCIK